MLPVIVYFIYRMCRRYFRAHQHAEPIAAFAHRAQPCRAIKLMIIFLMAIAPAASAQPGHTEASTVKVDYLKKSQRQKTTGWLMLGGGFAMSMTGLLIALDDLYGDGSIDAERNLGSAILFYTGSAVSLGSLPFFLAAARNKGRWLQGSAGIKMERLPTPGRITFSAPCYPALSLKFSLK